MFSISQTDYQLEIRDGRDGDWRRANAGMFSKVRRLASDGRIAESLRLAEKVKADNFGPDRAIDFRIVATTRTVSTMARQLDQAALTP